MQQQQIVNMKVFEEAHQAADELTGIKNIKVIRSAAQQTIGMLTPDMVQINNYGVIPVRTHGADLTTADQQKEFLRERIKGSLFEKNYEELFGLPSGRGHNRVIFKSPFVVFPTEEDRQWFHSNYIFIGVPVWMFIVHNKDVQMKYNLEFSPEQLSGIQHLSVYNSMRAGHVRNLFSNIPRDQTDHISEKSTKIVEDIAAILKANLYYFAAISTKVDPSIGISNEGFVHVHAQDIGTKLQYVLTIMERTTKNISLFSWDYEPNIIRHIITQHQTLSNPSSFFPTSMRGRIITYDDIMHFMGLYDI